MQVLTNRGLSYEQSNADRGLYYYLSSTDKRDYYSHVSKSELTAMRDAINMVINKMP